MQNFVDDQWTKDILDKCFAKLNPVLIAKMERKIPHYVATFRDVVVPGNQINVIPNLAPMLASVINQVCEQHVSHQTEKFKKFIESMPRQKQADQRLAIDLNVIAQLPKKGATVRRATAFDRKGNVTEMTETEL